MRRIILVCIFICGTLFLAGCKSGRVNVSHESVPVESNSNVITDYKVNTKEYEAYNQDNKLFQVKYVQISDMDDKNLENQINQTLKSSISEWIDKDCDWMEKSSITIGCKSSKYLSLIYKIQRESPQGKDFLGTFTRFGLTIDIQTGKRVLLDDLFNNIIGLKEKLVKYDYGNEISPPIDSDEADEIIQNASITEKEFYEENYKNDHSVYNFLWSKASFYLTDKQLVITRDENEFDDVYIDFEHVMGKKKTLYDDITKTKDYLIHSDSWSIADNNSTSNVVQQSAEATPTPINDELKWRWCIKPNKYSDLYFIDNDMIAATENYEKYVIVNTNGEIVIPFEYSSVESFEDGFALVKDDKNTFFINKKGENIFDKDFEDAYGFSDGLAAVKKDDLWGFIDKTGNMVIKNQFDQVENYSEGFAAVMKNNKWGFIDKSGKISIALKYDDVGKFSEGKAAVKLSNYNDDGDQWSYIDNNDNIVIDYYPYDAASDQIFCVGEFNEGLDFVTKTVVSIIDNNGKNIFLGNSNFFISSLSYNREYDVIPAYTYIDDAMEIKKYGLMGLTGNQRLEPIFDCISGIYGEYVVVESIVDGENKIGLIKIHKE